MSSLTILGRSWRGARCYASDAANECQEDSAYWVMLTEAATETRLCIEHTAKVRRHFPERVVSVRTAQPGDYRPRRA